MRKKRTRRLQRPLMPVQKRAHDLTLEKLLNAGTSPAESYRSRRKNTENVKGESR